MREKESGKGKETNILVENSGTELPWILFIYICVCVCIHDDFIHTNMSKNV